MNEPITHVGIDAHQRELHIAVLVGTMVQPLMFTSPTDAQGIARLRRKLEHEAPGAIECCYEAGPTGYGLLRQLTSDRIHCRVIAPSLIPRKPGERVKTNRRDARKLVELLRAGLLTTVQPPSPEAEAVRDLCRAHDDARSDLMRARHRLSKLLLRRGALYAGGKAWTKRHFEWLNTLAWPHPAERHVVGDYRIAIQQIEARRTEIDRLLEQLASAPPYRHAAGALRCFRGIDTLTAMSLLAELYDVHRFPHPRALMAYVGLVPSEASTGDRHRRGAITRAGNGLVRRLLVQAAWHYYHQPRQSVGLKARRVGQPPSVIAIADKAEQRLCRRFARLSARGKPKPVVTIAVARELLGFLWAAMQLPEAQML